MKHVLGFSVCAAVLVLLGVCGDMLPFSQQVSTGLQAVKDVATRPAAAAQTARTIEWDDLIPDDFHFDDLLKDLDLDIDEIDLLSDDDPRALELMEKLLEVWNDAPVVEAMDGQTVRLPGFVVPLEGDGEVVREFLLVPYYGACIHVPPPPANQTVHVTVENGDARIRGLFDTVWVTGVITVERKSSALAESGYQLRAVEVTPYDE